MNEKIQQLDAAYQEAKERFSTAQTERSRHEKAMRAAKKEMDAIQLQLLNELRNADGSPPIKGKK